MFVFCGSALENPAADVAADVLCRDLYPRQVSLGDP